jgi:hypothetical protein
MLNILLLILKIAGIFIAAIVVLILLIVAAILFVPVRYDIRAEYYDKPNAVVRFSWLFHILSARAAFDDGFKAYVKVLGFSLYNTEKKALPSNKTKKNKKKQRTVFDEFEETDAASDGFHENTVANERALRSEEADLCKTSQTQEAVEVEDFLKKEKETPKKKTSGKKRKRHFIKRFIYRLKKKIISIKEKIFAFIRGIYRKAVSAKDSAKQKLQQVKDTINDEENRQLLAFLWSQFKAVLKKIKPQKYKIYCRYGFDDPEITGKIAVKLAVAYGIIGADMNIIPDFEQKIFEGNVYFKGKVRIYGLLIIAVRVYRNHLFRSKILKKA